MTTALIGVAFDGPATAARHAPTLAGLPARFRTVAKVSDADILVVDGTTPDWPAACTRAAAVLVDRPRAADGEPPHRPRVFADLGYPADPAWTAELPGIRASLDDTVSIVESTVTVTGPDELPDSLLSQLTMLRALFGDIGTLTPSAVTARRGYLLTAAAGGTVISLSGTVGPEAGLVLVTASQAERRHLSLYAPHTARPARITRFTGEGRRTVRPVFESSRRALWRGVHSTLTGTGTYTGAHQLAAALPDLAVATSVLGAPHPTVR
ncbi:hypothetical protein ACIBLA_14900 [Streptomyces sp. NPDC050433]|uniref:hypothetical protein n=1 Tax=Streptomyces sp. NPDC050433 TaxID=3365615 RepID=UPI0037B30041